MVNRLVLLLTILTSYACGSGVNPKVDVVRCETGECNLPALVSLSIIAGISSEVVKVRGQHFTENMKLRIDNRIVPAEFVSPNEIIFQIPPGPPGRLKVSTLKYSENERSELWIYRISEEIPTIALSPTQVCRGLEFYDAQGLLQVGTRECESHQVCSNPTESNCILGPDFVAIDIEGLRNKILKRVDGNQAAGLANCTKAGQLECLANDDFMALDRSEVSLEALDSKEFHLQLGRNQEFAFWDRHGQVHSLRGDVHFRQENLRTNINFWGLEGTRAARPSDCDASTQLGCVTSAAFPAAEISRVQPANIKAGEILLNVNGDYPSINHPLAGATALSDLSGIDATTEAGSYEYFDSQGTRYSATIAELTVTTAGSVDQSYDAENALYRQLSLQGAPTLLSSNIRTGINIWGVGGDVVAASAPCGMDGEDDCVIDSSSSFRAANTVGAAYKLLLDSTLAGVPGNVTIPSPSEVMSGINFGPNNSLAGSLTLPAPENVLKDTPEYGDAQNLSIPTYDPEFPDRSDVRKTAMVGGEEGLIEDCSADLRTDCVTGTNFPAMDFREAGELSNLNADNFNSRLASDEAFEFWDGSGQRHVFQGSNTFLAENIRKDMELFGLTGTMNESPDNCSEDLRQECVAVGTYFAAASCDQDGESQCFLPAFDSDTQPLRALDYDHISLNKTQIRSAFSILDLDGELNDCSADGELDCVIDGDFAAMATAGAADQILSQQTLGGISGNVVLPASEKVLDGVDFGLGGSDSSGGLTLPLAGNVLAGTASFGNPASLIAPTYNPNFPAPADVRIGATTGGEPGLLVTCSSGNTIGCITTADFPSMNVTTISGVNLTAENFDSRVGDSTAFEFWDSDGVRHTVIGSNDLKTANIRVGLTLFGIEGILEESPGDCTTNGSQGCVAIGDYFAAPSCASSGDDACYLASFDPDEQVMRAINYDAIDPEKFLENMTIADISGELPVIGTWDMNVAFPGAAYYSQLNNPPDTALMSANIAISGEVGSIPDCAADRFTACLAIEDFPAVDAELLIASNIRNGVELGGVVGAYPSDTYPLVGSDPEVNDLTIFGADTELGLYQFFNSFGNRQTGTVMETDEAVVAGTELITEASEGGLYRLMRLAGAASLFAGNIRQDIEIFGVSGTASPRPEDCDDNALQGCVSTEDWIAVDLTNAVAENIRDGVSIAGVSGNLPSYPLCDAGNQQNCVSNDNYRTIDLTEAGEADQSLSSDSFHTALRTAAGFEFWTASGEREVIFGDANLVEANLRNGVNIHGVAGSYPSDSNPLASSTEDPEDLSLFFTQLQSDESFQFFDRTGIRYVAAGSEKLIASNIRRGTNVLGIDGSLLPPPAQMQAHPGSERMTISWSEVADAAGYLLLVRAGQQPTFTPDSGTTYTLGAQGADEIVYIGSNLNYTHDSLSPDVEYHYAIFSYDASHYYSLSPTRTQRRAFSCEGLVGGSWIAVPGDPEFGTQDFCMMKYEAKNIAESPESQPAEVPWMEISLNDSTAKCTALGDDRYSLISDAQWMTMATSIMMNPINWEGGVVGSGRLNVGNGNNATEFPIPAHADDSFACYGIPSLDDDCSGQWNLSKRTFNLLNGEIVWDVSGNAGEWTTSLWIFPTADDKPHVSSDGGAVTEWREFTLLDTGFDIVKAHDLRPLYAIERGWNSNQRMGQYYSGVGMGARAMRRGGGWQLPARVGIFSAGLSASPAGTRTDTGFRCAAKPNVTIP